jgi:hypothetical protein
MPTVAEITELNNSLIPVGPAAYPHPISTASLPHSFHTANPKWQDSISSVSTNPRPNLTIYANARGDVAYKPDPKFSRALPKGYKINLVQASNHMNIHHPGESRLHGQYAVEEDGTLRVNGARVPVYAGYEHGRTFVPHSTEFGPQTADLRERKRKGKLGKVLCGIGVVVVVVVGCVVSHVCC